MGTGCTVCDGYNGGDTDHCQCPNDSYLPQPGTEICWTCGGISTTLTDGGCKGDFDEYNWGMADYKKPENMRMPTLDEVLALFENPVWNVDHYDISLCKDDAVCSSVFSPSANYPYRIWTSTECGTETYHYYQAVLVLGGIYCVPGTADSQTSFIVE